MLMPLIDARVKLFLLFVAGILALALDRPVALMLAASVAFLAMTLAAVQSNHTRRALFAAGFMLLTLWSAGFAQGMFYDQVPRTEIIGWHPENGIGRWIFGPSGLALYKEGFVYGFTQGLRVVLTAAAGFAVIFSTDPGQLLAALSFYRVPRGLAFMAVTALRFVPLLAQEAATSWQAARLRGYSPSPLRSGTASLTVPFSLAQPVLASCMRRSSALAASLELRGLSENPAVAKGAGLSMFSLLVVMVGFAIGAGVFASKLAFWLYQMDLVYVSSWREWYDFTRRWM
jgi:energy-coupling factor transport system permease protein